MRWAKWLCAGLGVGLLIAPAAAKADVPTRLVYVRTPEAAACPDQAALQKAVEARLGHDPFSIWGENTVIATVSGRGAKLRARAEFIDGAGVVRGSREVDGESSDCGELILALALAISITLDPMQAAPVERQPESPPEPTPPEPSSDDAPPPDRAQAEPTSVVAPSPAERRPHALVWRAHAALFGSLGALPTPSPGARFGLSLQRARLLGGAEVGASLPASEELDGVGDTVVFLVAANVFPCLAISEALFGCALGSMGAFRARGRGISSPRSETLWYAAAGARLGFEQPLGERWALSLRADLLGTFTRPNFTLNGVDVWRPPPVAGTLAVGFSLRFS